MNAKRIVSKLLSAVWLPIRTNAVFFIMMYVLVVLTEHLTLVRAPGIHIYQNLYLELFMDVYVACVVLTLLPEKVRRWVRRVLYVVLYAVAIIDVFCFWKFSSTINPTMLLLVGETDGREAGEFLRQYLTPDVIVSPVGWILLLIAVHALVAWKAKFLAAKASILPDRARPFAGLAVAAIVVWSCIASWPNKVATVNMYSSRTIGDIERELTKRPPVVFYTPMQRLIFSLYSNHLASKQIATLIKTSRNVSVDSCSFRSPEIVLIIGESYGKHHSEQYGYFMPTTPRQIRREKTGLLVKYSDVVSPHNLTSFVFKNVFSMHVIGQKGEWCDYPLFPEVFRKAGYHVTFLTNQFLPKAKEAVYDFSGGFFLNNPELSRAQFDTRNSSLHQYDDGLLSDFDTLRKSLPEHNLIIFHLIGQHVSYKQRYPRDRRKFTADDYKDLRPDLSPRKRDMLSHYDNACLYNDSIVDEICRRFENDDAIVIYMPDHGEECYEGTRNMICRNHSGSVDYALAKYEFEIPFWVFCSHKYVVRHPEIYQQIIQSRDRRLMTDALPHMLLYLAGIHTKDYHAEYNILSPDYNELRPRILKSSADYDKLRKEAAHE